ncbi:MAG TPA: hypothetical protein VJ552_05860 [Sediminibacterium sp.]|nr:hypothetical protein [Sediminibacterium sp.]
MAKFQYEITIEAKEELHADAKMQALSILATKLSVKEICKLADVIQHDPIKTALAKKYLGV